MPPKYVEIKTPGLSTYGTVNDDRESFAVAGAGFESCGFDTIPEITSMPRTVANMIDGITSPANDGRFEDVNKQTTTTTTTAYDNAACSTADEQ
jgi:hypothetical protein